MTIEEVKIEYPLLWEAFLKECGGPGGRGIAERILDGCEPTYISFEALVNQAILWDKSIYGRSLWSAVHQNDYERARLVRPELFIGSFPKSGTIIKNGLFKLSKLNKVKG